MPALDFILTLSMMGIGGWLLSPVLRALGRRIEGSTGRPGRLEVTPA